MFPCEPGNRQVCCPVNSEVARARCPVNLAIAKACFPVNLEAAKARRATKAPSITTPFLLGKRHVAPKSGQELPGGSFLATSATSSRRGTGEARPATDRAGGRHALGPPLAVKEFGRGAEIRRGCPRSRAAFREAAARQSRVKRAQVATAWPLPKAGSGGGRVALTVINA